MASTREISWILPPLFSSAAGLFADRYIFIWQLLARGRPPRVYTRGPPPPRHAESPCFRANSRPFLVSSAPLPLPSFHLDPLMERAGEPGLEFHETRGIIAIGDPRIIALLRVECRGGLKMKFFWRDIVTWPTHNRRFTIFQFLKTNA